MWFLRIEPKVFGVLLLTIFIILLYVGYSYTANDHYSNNLIVELVGVTLELLIVLFIFNYWQERSKKAKLITFERRLREYLIFFLKHNFKTLPPHVKIGRFYGADHAKNVSDLERLRKFILQKGLQAKEEASIKRHCTREINTLNALLPVASELTDEHFKSWCRIVNFVNCIASDIEPTQKATIDIIQNIIKFDTASFDHNLYVGAEEV